jgi:hypothetical protein
LRYSSGCCRRAASAVGRRRDLFNEQIVQAVVGMPIGQREIQRALYLPAELARLSFNLPS